MILKKSKRKKTLMFLLLCIAVNQFSNSQIDDRVVLGYFPSWSESWTSANQNSKLREIPDFVNYVFLSFAKPNLSYTAGTYDISQTGIQTPYDGCTLKESVAALKNKGINVILSIGGETYWGTSDAYNINYQQIKDLVDDMGFVGIDWDFEPNGSFTNIGSPENVQHFIDFFNNSRALMPKSEGYILACAPSGVGALGGSTNDDPASPFAYANRNTLTGEDDTNLYNATVPTNGINLFGFSATGHMIPVLNNVGSKIDLIAFQGYNAGASTNRSIMYDAFAYYAEQYDISIAAGVHFPNEPWGPYYEYTHENVASLSNHIEEHAYRNDDNDGIMIWQVLMEGTDSSAYSYLNVASAVLNGVSEVTAIQNANNFSMSPYSGGVTEGCNPTGGGELYCGVGEYDAASSYPTANTQVYHECKIWKNQWHANPNEIPGDNSVWTFVSDCNEGDGCTLSVTESTLDKIILYPNPSSDYIEISNLDEAREYKIYNLSGQYVSGGTIERGQKIDVRGLNEGVYFIQLENNTAKFIKD